MQAPKALGPGSRLALVAPASPFDVQAFETGARRLSARYRVSYDRGIVERAGFLAGDDDRRGGELEAALSDEDVDAIVCARGGYGATRLLDRVSAEDVRAHPKLLVGFSDVTALHALWARAGVRSLHGAMVTSLANASEEAFQRWTAAIEGGVPAPVEGLATNRRGRARGALVGGNLAVLTALIATPYELPLGGRVLFLEDTGERPYRLDRMLTTWRQAGRLARPSAIVLGAFSDCDDPGDGPHGLDVVWDHLRDLSIPVLSGLNAGHIPDNLELPLGAEVTADAHQGTLHFHDPATQ